MAVLRIVPNLRARDPTATLASGDRMKPQLSLMSEGGAGTDIPDISIEVDDVDGLHAAARRGGHEIVHPLTDEEWGVRRFFVRDPEGHLVNVLSHRD
mgnify:CR=1 FL=1